MNTSLYANHMDDCSLQLCFITFLLLCSNSLTYINSDIASYGALGHIPSRLSTIHF